MVAYNPRTPADRRRMLSADVAERLHAAIVARWQDVADDDALTAALSEAAQDARQRSLLPEELLLALKAIEEEVGDKLRAVDADDRDRFRHWLVGACMRAFFNDQGSQGASG